VGSKNQPLDQYMIFFILFLQVLIQWLIFTVIMSSSFMVAIQEFTKGPFAILKVRLKITILKYAI
jgi:hypothetical protein